MRSGERWLNKQVTGAAGAAVAALAVNAALFAAFLGFASPAFETNDDALMMGIASGAVTGHPSEYLVFTNIVIGRLLKWLYSLGDLGGGVAWYSISLYAAHFCAMTTLLAVLLRRYRFGPGLLCYLLLFAGFEIRLLLHVQFTSTAFVLVISGILLVLTADVRCSRGLVVAIVGITEIAWGTMIREQALYLAAGVSCPLWIAELYRRQALRTGVVLAFGAVAAVSLVRYDRAVYGNHPEWSAFREFNALRGRIHGSPLLAYDDRSKPVLDRLGWSGNDVAMFQSWFFSDEDLFSTAALQQIVAASSGRTRADWASYLMGRLAAVDLYLLLTVFSVTLTFWLAGAEWKPLLGVGLATLGLCGTILVYLALYRWVPDRVLLSLVFYVNVLACYLASDQPRSCGASGDSGSEPGSAVDSGVQAPQRDNPVLPRTRRGLIAVAFMGCAAAMWLVTQRHLAINQGNAVSHRAYRQFIEELRRDYVEPGNEPLFVCWGGVLPNEWVPVFSNGPQHDSLPMLRIGWSVRSPHFQLLLAKYGIDDLYKSLYERPHVYLLCTQSECSRLQAFVREHYGTQIACRIEARYTYEHETTAGPRELTVRKVFRLSE